MKRNTAERTRRTPLGRPLSAAGRALVLAVSLLPAAGASAQTMINLSNLETVLAEPDNTDAKMYALWAGFFTQVYEYSMPFVEIALDPDDMEVSEFRMTIGDTAFRFNDEFQNVNHTNSTAVVQPGGFARLGQSSSPGVGFSSSVEDGGDTLVLDFGSRGLQPGETVRFQVDLAADDPSGDMFPSYTSVLFDANGNPPQTSDNSTVRLTFENGFFRTATLPDFTIDPSTLPTQSRSYSVMQMVDPVDPQEFGDLVIPEPTAATLALIGSVATLRRRSSQRS